MNVNIGEIAKIKLIFYIFVWLLLLPNAQYIITDFIHLHNTKAMLVWLDIFMLFNFSCTGLLLAVVSINDVFQIIKKNGV